jgi:hypothetical protein
MHCWFWRLAETSAVASICFSNLCGGGLQRHVLCRSAEAAFAMVSRRRLSGSVLEFLNHAVVNVPAHTVTPTSTPSRIPPESSAEIFLEGPRVDLGRPVWGRESSPREYYSIEYRRPDWLYLTSLMKDFWFQNPIPKSIATAADWYDVHWMLAGCRGNP